MAINLDLLSEDEKRELIELWNLAETSKRRNWLATYKPYAKQVAFHNAGSNFRERCFLAANQSGKTLSAAAEIAIHATGLYPDWWRGWRFNRPTVGIVGSESFDLNKRGLQRLLLGRADQKETWGTGTIPFEQLVRYTMVQGVQDAVATITVKHVPSGENSVIQLASYEQGRAKWQADTVDYVFMDEEPPSDIYFEGLTRTNVSGGPIAMTFTPLLGASQVVRLFLPLDGHRAPQRELITMTIDDAEHYTPEERAKIIAQYPEHEREARAFGRPVLGSGMVFPVAESAIRVEPFKLPPHWGRLVGLDLGWDHPTAAAWIAYDVDSDTIYVYRDYKKSRETISVHAATVRSPAPWIPVAWPHDALQHDRQAGKSLKQLYIDAGLKMLPKHATFKDDDPGAFSFEAGIYEMVDRMQTGRLKIFSTCTNFFQEMRGYHRKDGKVVKIEDDVISAVRYAMMMKRYARSQAELAPQKAEVGPLVSFGVLDADTGYAFPDIGYDEKTKRQRSLRWRHEEVHPVWC